MKFSNLKHVDPDIYNIILQELDRQRNTIELISSENFTSKAVMAAQGSVLTNKYAEGYPGRRYYGGCQFVDVIEQTAMDRAKALFGAEYTNVQPHSGAQANMAAYFSILKPGDVVLGLNLSHGGHLTHGAPVNFSGQLYEFHAYGVDPQTEQIDFDQVRDLALKHRPKLVLTGASAYPRILDFARFKEIADEVDAMFMVDMAHIAGLVAAGVHPSPVPYCEIVTTTTHKSLRGPRAGLILAKEQFGPAIDKSIFPGTQGGPLMHVVAAKAVCFKEAATNEFKTYSEQIVKNARALSARLRDRGFRMVSGGTDTHLMLVNLNDKNITGAEAQTVLDEVGITVNKNTVPFETRSPFVTSGIRIGTPAATSRGFKEPQMESIGDLIADTLLNIKDSSVHDRVAGRVKELCEAFPLYKDVEV